MERTSVLGRAFAQAPRVIGSGKSTAYSDEILQHHENNCCVRVQEIILRQFGKVIPEEVLCEEAEESHWYSPEQGTELSHLGNLLEEHQISVRRCCQANVYNLAEELSRGHAVIVAVNAEQLEEPSATPEAVLECAPNHALMVVGLDTTNRDCHQVILQDPGSGAVAQSVPLTQFLAAWQHSSCYMVATTEPVPGTSPYMENFDYDEGHIENIGELSYEKFIKEYGPYCADDAHAEPFTENDYKCWEIFSKFVNSFESSEAGLELTDDEEDSWLDEVDLDDDDDDCSSEHYGDNADYDNHCDVECEDSHEVYESDESDDSDAEDSDEAGFDDFDDIDDGD